MTKDKAQRGSNQTNVAPVADPQPESGVQALERAPSRVSPAIVPTTEVVPAVTGNADGTSHHQLGPPAGLTRDEYQRADMQALAKLLAGDYQNEVEALRAYHRANNSEFREPIMEPQGEAFVRYALSMQPHLVDSRTLRQLEFENPRAAVALWGKIKQTALDDLRSGLSSGIAVTDMHDLWKRARYTVQLTELMETWQPRDGVERSLIVQLAQTLTLYEEWLGRLNGFSHCLGSIRPSSNRPTDDWGAPRMTDAEAIQMAAGMVDRINRQYLRTVRALRDLRRYQPQVIVQNAEQVNVGNQQVNVGKVQTGASAERQEGQDGAIEKRAGKRGRAVYEGG